MSETLLYFIGVVINIILCLIMVFFIKREISVKWLILYFIFSLSSYYGLLITMPILLFSLCLRGIIWLSEGEDMVLWKKEKDEDINTIDSKKYGK